LPAHFAAPVCKDTPVWHLQQPCKGIKGKGKSEDANQTQGKRNHSGEDQTVDGLRCLPVSVLQAGNHAPGRGIATGAFSNKLLLTKYQAPPIKHSSQPKPIHPEGLEPHCLNRSKRVNKKAIPKNGPIIFAKRIPQNAKKISLSPGTEKKQPKINFIPTKIPLISP
jgi:hypothetical protein